MDNQQTPTAFIGLVTTTHVDAGGDGLTLNLAVKSGQLVGNAALDDDGDAVLPKGKYGGEAIRN